MRKTPANDDARSGDRLAISDGDLAAYVDDGLGPDRRLEVEGFLACNPDVAARVMTERHRRGRAAARRTRAWRPVLYAGLAVCLVSGAAGWRAAAQPPVTAGWRESDGDSAPHYVEDALESRQAARIRATMTSQIDSPLLDVAEVERALKVRAPRMPSGWRLVDAQVYPSDDGPALSVVVVTSEGRRLNLFTVKANAAVSATPVLAHRGRDAVAYWEAGSSAYVLMADDGQGGLMPDAQRLAQRLAQSG